MLNKLSKRTARLIAAGSIAFTTLMTCALSALAATSIGTDISTDGALSATGNVTFDTNTFFLNATSNQVGILTATPSAELDVRDSSPTPTSNVFQVANANDSTRYLTVSSTAVLIGATQWVPLAVGTSSPSSIASGHFHWPDGNGNGIVVTDQGTGVGDSNGGILGVDGSDGAFYLLNYEPNGYISFFTNTGSNLERMRLSAVGNLALGTTNTDARFAIRASGPVPTANLFQISNSNDSTRYLTVSSTATIVTNLTVTGTCSGCGSSTNLNQAYLSSTSTGATAELSVNSTLGALTIADQVTGGSRKGVGIGNIFEVTDRVNAAGTWSQRYFSVSATSVGIHSNSPNATLTVQHLNDTGGTVMDLRIGGTSIFSVDHQGNVIGDRSLTISRTAQFAQAADEYWPNPGLAIIPSATFAQDLIQTKTGTTFRFVVKNTGFVGVMTSTPSAEIDVRDTLSVPTSNIFQVANLNDSSRYFTVSSTSTSIQTELNLEDGTGSVSTNAVKVNTTAGVITDSTDIRADTTRAAITFTNSRIVATSVVTVSNCSTPDTNAMLVSAVAPGAGSATITVRNAGSGNQTSDWKLCFRVTN